MYAAKGNIMSYTYINVYVYIRVRMAKSSVAYDDVITIRSFYVKYVEASSEASLSLICHVCVIN